MSSEHNQQVPVDLTDQVALRRFLQSLLQQLNELKAALEKK
ncbi:hypothetical protein ETP1_039 [Edwardsiella phage ETP-1]|uniref:Uncharacterized protein n=3 Tax=Kafunavirus KF1 TaxID=1982588 RepID=A0A6G5P4Y5_9CAUD|nr:hypothetical protein D877_gp41 [Edwardsiella phage KF-1]QBP07040.1 hypothetical protein ETP1_039 [Edwardsiella phage ETP-1]BAM63089.1 hypothetical protein [Edwardsiella phage KF-1]BAM63138.1 hypothetical protein [Edwardsiella phage IW-1]